MSTPALLAAVANHAVRHEASAEAAVPHGSSLSVAAAAHGGGLDEQVVGQHQSSSGSVAFGSPVVAQQSPGVAEAASVADVQEQEEDGQDVQEEDGHVHAMCEDDSTVDLYQQIIRRRSSPKPQRVLLGAQPPKQPSPATPAARPATTTEACWENVLFIFTHTGSSTGRESLYRGAGQESTQPYKHR